MVHLTSNDKGETMSEPMNYNISSELVSASSALNMHVEEVASGKSIAESSYSANHAVEHIRAAIQLCDDKDAVSSFAYAANNLLEDAGLEITPHESIINMYFEIMTAVRGMLEVSIKMLDLEYLYDGRDGMDVFLTDVDPTAELCVKTLSLAIDEVGVARRLLWRARLVVDRRMALENGWDKLSSSRWESFDRVARRAEEKM